MIYSQIFVAFILVFALILWWLVTTGYPDYQLDKFRERLFSIRSRLFAMASEHGVFETTVYQMTRQTLNGAIRYAHKPSMLSYMIHSRLMEKKVVNHMAATYANALRHGLKEVPPEVRIKVQKAHQELHEEFFRYMIKSSWLFGPLSLFIISVLNCFDAVRKVQGKLLYRRSSRRQMWRMDATVNAVGADTQPLPPRRRQAEFC